MRSESEHDGDTLVSRRMAKRKWRVARRRTQPQGGAVAANAAALAGLGRIRFTLALLGPGAACTVPMEGILTMVDGRSFLGLDGLRLGPARPQVLRFPVEGYTAD